MGSNKTYSSINLVNEGRTTLHLYFYLVALHHCEQLWLNWAHSGTHTEGWRAAGGHTIEHCCFLLSTVVIGWHTWFRFNKFTKHTAAVKHSVMFVYVTTIRGYCLNNVGISMAPARFSVSQSSDWAFTTCPPRMHRDLQGKTTCCT